MVNKIIKVYLPSISMAFTMIILMSGIRNWLVEKELNDFVSFSFGLFGFLIIIHILIEHPEKNLTRNNLLSGWLILTYCFLM